jgi:exodeoxyribonuclease VII small subunit
MMSKTESSTSPVAKKDQEDPIDFEASLAGVEQIVAGLESGELGLTESLEQYETGIKQLKRCHALLDAAEQRVSLLSGFDADGNPVQEPMHETEAATSDRKEGGQDALNSREPSRLSVDDTPGLF